MFGLRTDMFGGNWICLAQTQICPIRQVYALRKSTSKAKTINLGPDKLINCKQDIIEHIEIRGTTSCNQITRNHT
jgi:hypothetical protein